MHIECMYVYLIYIFASVLVVVLTQTHSTYIGLRIHKMSKIKIKNIYALMLKIVTTITLLFCTIFRYHLHP